LDPADPRQVRMRGLLTHLTGHHAPRWAHRAADRHQPSARSTGPTTTVISLWSRAGFRIGPSETREGIALVVARGPEVFLVATVGQRVVGAVLGAFDGRRGWIYHLAVAEDRQRSGVGRLLLDEVERRLRAKGCLKVNLLVAPENAGVVPFYERLGYSQDELV